MQTIIRIDDIMESNRVKVFDFGSDIPLDTQPTCPACLNRLDVAALLVGEGLGQKMRFGVCSECGYMGYIDRPTQKWMIDFYRSDWDRAFPRTTEQIREGTILPGKGVKAERYVSASLLQKIQPDRNKPFLEIGSGYGEVLKYFKDQGFQTVVGVENSKHRADLVNKVLGFTIFQGGFEEDSVQESLTKIKPIGLIFSNHVLEHTYNPDEILRKISSLQDLGEYLILSLPNAWGEHINYAFLYLVHLHSFTKESLETLLNRHGYEIVADNSPDEFSTAIAAKKVQNPKPTLARKTNYLDIFNARVRKGLSIDLLSAGKNELYWEQCSDYDFSRVVRRYGNKLSATVFWKFEKLVALIRVRLRRFSVGYKLILELIEKGTGLPLEIRFPKNIQFLIK